MKKKKMIFVISIAGVVVIAAIILAIGQLTGKFPIIRTNKSNNSSVSSNIGGSDSDKNSDENNSSADSSNYNSSGGYQAKHDDIYYIELAKSNPVKITKAQYDQTQIIENSDTTLTYEQVCAIVGGEGTPMETENQSIKSYMWTSEDGNGYAKFVFEGGKLVSRAQIGLK